MDQKLRTMAVFPEDLCLIYNTHFVAHNCLRLQFQGIRGPLLACSGTREACGAPTHMPAKHSYPYKNEYPKEKIALL